MQKNILIADDHPVYLLGLKTLIDSQPHCYRVLHQASSTDDVINKLGQQPVDAVVTDFSMPGPHYPDGLPFIQLLKQQWPMSQIIVVTMITNVSILEALTRLGTYPLSKNSLSSDLLEVLCRVFSSSRTPAPPVLLPHPIGLSPREAEVLRLLSKGLGVNEISALLHRTKQTISTQKISVMRKLNVKSEYELFQYMQRIGFSS